jgi:hypothetical protein
MGLQTVFMLEGSRFKDHQQAWSVTPLDKSPQAGMARSMIFIGKVKNPSLDPSRNN